MNLIVAGNVTTLASTLVSRSEGFSCLRALYLYKNNDILNFINYGTEYPASLELRMRLSLRLRLSVSGLSFSSLRLHLCLYNCISVFASAFLNCVFVSKSRNVCFSVK